MSNVVEKRVTRVSVDVHWVLDEVVVIVKLSRPKQMRRIKLLPLLHYVILEWIVPH